MHCILTENQGQTDDDIVPRSKQSLCPSACSKHCSKPLNTKRKLNYIHQSILELGFNEETIKANELHPLLPTPQSLFYLRHCLTPPTDWSDPKIELLK